MMRSTIESLVKLPTDASAETNNHSKKEEAIIVSINKAAQRKEAEKIIDDRNSSDKESKNHSKGYIKYPTYDFF